MCNGKCLFAMCIIGGSLLGACSMTGPGAVTPCLGPFLLFHQIAIRGMKRLRGLQYKRLATSDLNAKASPIVRQRCAHVASKIWRSSFHSPVSWIGVGKTSRICRSDSAAALAAGRYSHSHAVGGQID